MGMAPVALADVSRGAHATRPRTPPAGIRPSAIADGQPIRSTPITRESSNVIVRAVLALCGLALTSLAVALASAGDPSRSVALAIPGLTALVVALAPMEQASRAILAYAPALSALLVVSLAMPGARGESAVLIAAIAGVLPAALRFRAIAGPSRLARQTVGAGLALTALWLVLPGGGGVFALRGGAWTLTHLTALALCGVTVLSVVAILVAGAAAGHGAWAALIGAWAGFATLVHHAMSAGESTSWPPWATAAAMSTLSAQCAFSGAALLATHAAGRPLSAHSTE